MDNYLNSFREMISLRGLTDHALKSYCTYINAYLDYLANVLHKSPEDVSWDELRVYIRWIQNTRGLSDRTINCAISQLRFFTMYVLHKPWDDTQLPLRKFDTYMPFVPSKEEIWQFISTIPDLKVQTMVTLMYSSGLRIGEVCSLRYENIQRKNMRIHIPCCKNRQDRYAILSSHALDLLTRYWMECGKPMGICSQNSGITKDPLIPFSFSGISMPMKTDWDGNAGLPAIPSDMLLVHIYMKMALIYLPSKLLWDISHWLLP